MIDVIGSMCLQVSRIKEGFNVWIQVFTLALAKYKIIIDSLTNMEQDHPSTCQDQQQPEPSENIQPSLLTLPQQHQTDTLHQQSQQPNAPIQSEHPNTAHQCQHPAKSAQSEKMEEQQTISTASKQGPLNKLSYFQQGGMKGRFLSDMGYYFESGAYRKLGSAVFSEYISIPSKNDEDRVRFSAIFAAMKKNNNFNPSPLGLSERESRGVAAVLGMAICDALGASTQFQHFSKQGLGLIKKGFEDIKYGRHGMIGVWTDDASMGLCMADSILLNDYVFNPVNIRYLFNLWLHHGLNNGGRPHSIGLGGNISISMNEFMHRQEAYTEKGDRFNNGNGSLMRLAPIPVAYANHPQKAVQYSGLSSETTHNGYQAAECCRLMGKIIIELINRPQGTDGKQLLKQVCDTFTSKCRSVQNLARSECDDERLFGELSAANSKFKAFNKQLKDRDWNWRDQKHTYAPTRLKQQPGYIGSYCMDALAMALHTVWFTNSFKEVAIMNADMGGDCDTVGSVAGQIAGALYGVGEEMMGLYSQMQDFGKERYEVFVKGYKLINNKLLR